MARVTLSGALALLLLAGCGGGGGSGDGAGEAVTKAALGEALFFDTNLSLNKTMACATCHDPDHGFIDARYVTDPGSNPVGGALSVGDDGAALGGRNAPTAAYAMFSPTFGQDNEGTYVGGQFHDGRAADLKAQAKGPFLDTAEMMMPDRASVVERVMENAAYVTALRALYGETIFDDVNASYDAVAESIAAYEQTETFAPFDSKYDRFLRGEYTMTDEEDLGYALFFSQANTNCATCHTLNSESESANETFTNYEYENIGTPRNYETLAAKGLSEETQDLGLGARADINDSAHYGKVKVPTLRNIAVTGPYMSNGVFKELRTVLEFYDHMAAQGNHPTNPETGEPWDAPDVNATVNREVLQATKALTDAKIDALIAFLKLLTDERYEALLDE